MSNTVVVEEEDEGGLYNLFVSEEYVEKSWKFGILEQKLLCSNMASTDYDLTGQIVWPACILLSWFIYRNQSLFQNKRVVELGAGCGLAGFVASNYASHCLITDGNDIVMRLLQQNVDHLKSENVTVSKLLWGVTDDIESRYLNVDESELPEVIIGADVILWPNMVFSLLYTIRLLLSYKPASSRCFISYIVRARSTTELLFKTVGKVGLIIEDIPTSAFVPEDCHFFDGTEKHLFSISIDPNVPFDKDSEEIQEYQRRMATTYAPC